MASTKSSIAHLESDPLRNFKFGVRFLSDQARGIDGMGFMSVTGLNITTEVIPYREGGMNTTTQKMPGQSDFAPLTLSRGLVVGKGGFMKWQKELFAVIEGTGRGPSGNDFRTDLLIDVYDHPVTKGKKVTKAQFKVFNAWPQAVAYSDLDAGANSLLITQMTLAHEGFEDALANAIGPSSVAKVTNN